MQTFIQVHLQLEISHEITVINEVFEILYPHFCFIQYYCLEDLVDAFLGDCESLKEGFKNYKKELKTFKKEAFIKTLCSDIQEEISREKGHIELKLMGLWSNITIKRFEKLVKHLFQNSGVNLGRISVRDGCLLIIIIRLFFLTC